MSEHETVPSRDTLQPPGPLQCCCGTCTRDATLLLRLRDDMITALCDRCAGEIAVMIVEASE